jgi:hypothetical protein
LSSLATLLQPRPAVIGQSDSGKVNAYFNE